MQNNAGAPVGSYDRIDKNAANEGKRQRAQMITELEVLLFDEQRLNPELFPHWLIFFRRTPLR